LGIPSDRSVRPAELFLQAGANFAVNRAIFRAG
jgi:hypothetical protein